MIRIKRARSVIHSVAHHGVSALSWLHPRLGEECKKQEINEIGYDLVNGKIQNKCFDASKETKRAFEALKGNFERICRVEGIRSSQIKSATIKFGFTRGRWPNYCICSLVSSNDKEISVKVDCFGNKYGVLSKYQPSHS